MPSTRLSETEVAALGTTMPNWTVEGGSLRRAFKFADFSTAWAFMTRVALLAEKHDHHPDWSNGYDKVDIALTSHAAGGLTALDLTMAKAIDRLG